MTIQCYFLGCPIWAERTWVGEFFTSDAKPAQFLSQYSSVFNTVEGNSTFYSLPDAATVARWRAQAAPGFQFCFKFPRRISHELRLQTAGNETREFLARLEPLGERLGPFFLQLPPNFSPAELHTLRAYLQGLPDEFHYAVEVRHPDFFAAGPAESALQDLLTERGMDRVILDSRALFSAAPDSAATRTAQARKPRLPVRNLAVGARPLVRFIGHPQLDANRDFLEPWVQTFTAWIAAGKTPYLFTHLPDNRGAPALARRFHRQLQACRGGEIGELPAWPAAAERQQQQLSLF